MQIFFFDVSERLTHARAHLHDIICNKYVRTCLPVCVCMCNVLLLPLLLCTIFGREKARLHEGARRPCVHTCVCVCARACVCSCVRIFDDKEAKIGVTYATNNVDVYNTFVHGCTSCLSCDCTETRDHVKGEEPAVAVILIRTTGSTSVALSPKLSSQKLKSFLMESQTAKISLSFKPGLGQIAA